MTTRYLLHFVHEHIAFRWTEFLAVASRNNCKFRLISKKEHINSRPFIIIELIDGSLTENLISSARSSFLLKDLYELWAQSNKSVEDLAIKASNSSQFESGIYSNPDQCFRVNVETFGNKISQANKVEWIKKMTFMETIKAKANLTQPKQIYCIMEMNERQNGCIISKEYYFGRHLAQGDRNSIKNYSLKTRVFIANTSMDPALSLITANSAKIKRNDLVFDPFVGSGSLLVAAAHLGAYVLGGDIDWLLMHGKSKPSRIGQVTRNDGEMVNANFKQYNLEDHYIDVMVSDMTKSPIKDRFEFDAIIADPPYGVRECSEKIGSKNKTKVLDNQKVRYPSKVDYSIKELLEDLLLLSVNHLSVNGRLVYWLPVTKSQPEQKFDDFIPQHPCLQLISYCEQNLFANVSRLMVVMEKIRNPKDYDRADIPQLISEMNFRDAYFKVKSS